jgi:uncharacterized membrane protein YfhO
MGHGFPMVDFNIGMGFDTITTLHYYVLGDPISLLTIFMTQENAVFFYNVLILLRIYLAGISFLIFCRYWGKDGHSVILGALIYVFCGYTYFSGIRHPYFLNPMIYLPLIIIGIEQVFRRKKPYLLIVITFVSTLSNFYFFYILTMIAIIYVIFRYISVYRKTSSKQFIGFIIAGFRIGGYYLIGTAMAAFVFLPMIYAFLQNGRTVTKTQMLTGYFHYNIGYYFLLLQGFFASGVTPHFWVTLAFPSIIAVSCVIALCNKRYRQLRLVFILSLCALFVPAFGYFMNGFSYVTNRWDFLFHFIVAILFTTTYEKIFKINNWEKVLLVLGILGYGALAFAFPAKSIVKITFFILLLTFALIMLLQTNLFKDKKVLQVISLYTLVFLTLGFNGYVFFSSDYHGYVSEFLTKDEVESMPGEETESLITDIKDDSFYRIETYGETVKNEALFVGFHDVSAYFSLMDGNITTYFKQLELLNQRSAYRVDNQDNRTILDALASVKYFISTDKTAAPYGYKLIEERTNGSNTYYLFENLFALPLGYTYENYMLEEDYNKLNTFEKQNALMYAVVLPKKSDFVDKTTQDMSVGITKLPVTILPDKNVVLGKNTIKVLNENAIVTLVFDAKPKSETYVRFNNLKINRKAMVMNSFLTKGEKEVTKLINIRNRYHNTYFGKENYLINTGYSKRRKVWAKITFPVKEKYSYDSIAVYNIQMKYYKQQVAELNKSTLQNVTQRNNKIEGDITLDKKGIMVLSIPFSKGWCGYVDGEKVELLKGNVMFTALPLDIGEHHVILKYQTPFLKEGFFISIMAFLVFIGIIIYNKALKKKH